MVARAAYEQLVAMVRDVGGADAAAVSALTPVEEDWLMQARSRSVAPGGGRVATWADAAGAVDGVKDGKYAFHTDREPNPWWQVDLRSVQEIARIVVYNRLDYAPGCTTPTIC